MDHLAVAGRAGLYIDNYQLVSAITKPFDAQGPDIDELLLPLDPGHVRRGASFVSPQDGSKKVAGKNEEREFHGMLMRISQPKTINRIAELVIRDGVAGLAGLAIRFENS
jgi:hypothetical protein